VAIGATRCARLMPRQNHAAPAAPAKPAARRASAAYAETEAATAPKLLAERGRANREIVGAGRGTERRSRT
jgi:hypothetical protein